MVPKPLLAVLSIAVAIPALSSVGKFSVRYLAEDLPPADFVLVEKSKRQLTLMANGTAIKTYPISLGKNPLGHKQEEGDSKTPEGRYVIDWRNLDSKFYRSLHISYPNAGDQARAAARGVSPGGAIMIHGLPNGAGMLNRFYAGRDWTDGCIAVDNVSMTEILASVHDGTPIEIRP